MKTTKTAIIVPSIREHSIQQFVEEWNIDDCDDYTLFVIEDNPTKTFKFPEYVRHYSHENIDAEFPCPEIIGRKTDAVRIFGFWKAWQEGYDYILTLDDDCYPNEKSIYPMQDLIEKHKKMSKINNPKLFNTMSRGFARGVPSYLKEKVKVGLSVGGWTNVPDIDGKTQLFLEKENLNFPAGKTKPEIISYGQLFAMSGMHVFFPIENVKYMYYFPHLDTYYRWADIWLGFCLKKLFDAQNIAIVNGAGLIKHSRASNAQKNFDLESTNYGYQMNDKFAAILHESKVNQFDDLLFILKGISPYFEKIAVNYGKWHNLFEATNGT